MKCFLAYTIVIAGSSDGAAFFFEFAGPSV
jgi:hypothetical protein